MSDAIQRLHDSFEDNLRVAAVVDLANSVGSEVLEGRLARLHGPIADLVEHLLETDFKTHLSADALRTHALAALGGEPDDALETFGDLLMNRQLLGFAVQFVTPVMTRCKRSWSWSWGYTQSTWVYADSYEQAWRLGIAWAKQCRKSAKPACKRRGAGAAPAGSAA